MSTAFGFDAVTSLPFADETVRIVARYRTVAVRSSRQVAQGSMQLFHDIFIVLALSQLITTSLYFLLHHRNQSGLLFLALFLCLACYVIYPHSLFDTGLDSYLYLVSLLTPMLLYAIARYLFLDGARMTVIDWCLLGYFVIARVLVGGFVFSRTGASDAVLITVYMLPLAILIYFAVMAAVFTTQGYRADLLENRRTLRVYFVIGNLLFIVPRLVLGLLVYSAMLFEDAEFGATGFPAWTQAVYIFLVFLAFNLLIFQRHEDLLKLFTETSVAPEAKDKDGEGVGKAEGETGQVRDDMALAQRITSLMQERRLYMQQGFTIADLARELSVHENQLRKAINKEMEFRNFNQFLNHYRLAEAGRLLRETDAPVSTIAFEVGYASLSSFNSVFKQRFAQTPTEYRQAGEP